MANFNQYIVSSPSSLPEMSNGLKQWKSQFNNSTMDPITASALISGGVGLLNGLFSSSSANKQAKIALKAQRETNEMNYKIWQEQKQHNLDMYNLQNEDAIEFWNMQNEYNSPENQRKLIEDAGYNPYSLLQGAGSEAGAISQASMQGTTPPTMQPPSDVAFTDPYAVGIQQALATFQAVSNSIFQGQSVTNQTNLANADVVLKNLDAVDKKYRNKYVNTMYDYQVKSMKQQYDQERAMFPLLKEQAILSNSMATAQLASINLDNRAKEIELLFLPAEKEVEFNTKVAMWVNEIRIGLKTEQEVKNLIAEEALTYAKIKTEGKNQRLIEEKIETENLNQVGISIDNERKQQEWSIDKIVDPEMLKEYSSYKLKANLEAVRLLYFDNANNAKAGASEWIDRKANPGYWFWYDTSRFSPKRGGLAGSVFGESADIASKLLKFK